MKMKSTFTLSCERPFTRRMILYDGCGYNVWDTYSQLALEKMKQNSCSRANLDSAKSAAFNRAHVCRIKPASKKPAEFLVYTRLQYPRYN